MPGQAGHGGHELTPKNSNDYLTKPIRISFIFVRIKTYLIMNCRIIALIFLLSTVFGCGKFAGHSVTETYELENTYKELHVSNAINVVISDTAEEVTVTAGENLLSNVIIEEKDNILDIRLKDGTYFFNSTVNIELPVNPNLTELTLSDASDIKGEVNAEELTINLRDASDAKLNGYVKKLTLNLKDASGIKKNIINSRYGLSCDECAVSMEDASDAYIHCDGTIRIVKLSGASDLHYTGNATIILVPGAISGASDVKNDVL